MAVKKPSTPLAWVGSITAVFSLIAGIYGGWAFLSGQLERRRAIDRLLAAEAVQLHTSDYESAWKTLAQAATIDPSSARVQQAQEDVAMQWLDNIRISGDQTFASVTEKLEPVLTRGVASAKSPQRQADLLAHLGWSYFLRSRELPASPDPEPAYRDALLKDPANPYAHAMWGHWVLWNHQGFAKASEHFAAALAAPRPALRPYIRTMQLSALNNEETPEAVEEMIRVADDIRKEHGDLDPRWPHDILNIYRENLVPPNEHTAAFLSAVPPPDHLDTFDWLLQRAGPHDSDSLARAYIRSALLEAAGRRDEALTGYRTLLARLGPDSNGSTLADITRKAIVRLTAAR
jgi:tetratricopeptide (TPR) repeat protein